jgi:hypothetical protein
MNIINICAMTTDHISLYTYAYTISFYCVGSAADVISGLSSTLHAQRIIQPSKSFFQTSTSSTFLRCFKGVQEGVLFPLEQGILFLKPIIFHPANKVDSIVAGRGGSALTKYIDLIVSNK